jgi:PAS domain S-box-containing protein
MAMSRRAVGAAAAMAGHLAGAARAGKGRRRPAGRPLSDFLPELLLRVRRDGSDGVFLEAAGANQLWPGCVPSALTGKTIRGTLPPELAQTAVECMDRALASGEPQVFDWRMPEPESPRDLEARVLANGAEEAVFILREVTAKQALESIIDASPLAIFATGVDGRITRWNAAAERIFGWSLEEALNQRLPFIPPSEMDAYEARTSDGKCSGGAGLELRGVRKDGQTVEVNLWRAPMKDAYGEVMGCIAIAVDVTEHRRLERQLQQAQRMDAVGRLAGGVAHDFNNLLTVITGYGYLVLEQADNDAAVRASAEEILRTVERASALTSQLLEFSKPQTGEPRAVDINELVLDMDKMLRRVIGEQIELVTALSPDAGMINADPAQIQQVIMNLLVNARDALPGGGRVTIETASRVFDEEFTRLYPSASSGEYVVLSVIDNGVGMDEETRAHIFEPFFTTKEQGKGTGLGLATVYGIVKHGRGEVAVSSAEGRGTEVKVYFPRVRPAAVAREAAPAETGQTRGTETVLLVEDEDEVRRLVSDVLEQYGYVVLPAARPQDAVTFCATHPGAIDLLLTDVVLPQMSGRALAEQARLMRPDLPVLLMSGYTEEALAGRGLCEPGTPFLRKPFTPTVLTRKIREVLDEERGRSAKAS